jgi:hypothetical protein
MRTRALLDLLGTDRGTLHRYAVALDQQPRVTHRRGHPYEWSPGACATLYTSYLLCHDSPVGPTRTAACAGFVGAAYDASWSSNPAAAPTWAACVNGSAFLGDTVTEVWREAQPETIHAVVRIVALSPLKGALMATSEEKPYVVTFGYTRRLIEAADRNEARVLFETNVGWPAGSTVGQDELVIRDATDADLYEFYPLRGRHQLRQEQETLFDMPRDPKLRAGEQPGLRL